MYGVDAALKAADVRMCVLYAPPSETNFGGALLTGSQSACKSACEAFAAAVEQVDAPLMSDGYELKDGEVVEMANPEIVPAGGASVTDDVIKSGMNYNVAGVVEG